MPRHRPTCTCGHALADHTASLAHKGRAGCLLDVGPKRCPCEGTFGDLGYENEEVQRVERLNAAIRERVRAVTYPYPPLED